MWSPPPPQTRHRVYIAILIPLVCFLCFYHLGELPLEGDEASYALVTEEILTSGNWLYPTRDGQPYLNKPPLYFWLSAVVRSQVDHPESGQRLVAASAAVAAILLTSSLGALLFGPEVGLLSALLLCLHHHLLLASSHGFRRGTMESALTALATLVMLLVARKGMRLDAKRHWIIIGLVAGTASMLKPFMGFLILVVVAAAHVFAPGELDRRTRCKQVGVAFAASAALWLPWHVALATHYRWDLLADVFNHQVVHRVVAGRPAHLRGIFFYPAQIIRTHFIFWPLVLSFPMAWTLAFRGRTQYPYRVLAVAVTAWIGIVSLSASKLIWYSYPVFPLVAVMIAATGMWILDCSTARWFRARTRDRRELIAVLVTLTLFVAGSIFTMVRGIEHLRTLGVEHEYAPWILYQNSLADHQPGPRFILFDMSRRQAGFYYVRKMSDAMKTSDTQLLRDELEKPGPVVVVLGGAPSEAALEEIRGHFRHAGGLNITAADYSLFLRGCEKLLNPTLGPAQE